MKELNIVLDKLEKICHPVSIFLYGSRARTDFLKRSDFEIGILMSNNRYVGKTEIDKVVNEKGINIYPFEYKNFVKYKIDTPFQKSIYLRELILSGKTLRGKKVIERMKPPPIKIVDLIQRIGFDLGFALASIISYRNGDFKTASLEFSKSCLFGVRNLEILKLKKFPLTYSEIYQLSKNLRLGEYKPLVSIAYYKLRLGKIKLQKKDLFKNISFLNEFIEPKIIQSFEKYGNKILMR